MNDTTLADLIRALNIMVLERVDTGVFTAIGTVPHWFAPTLLDAGYDQGLIRPGTKSLFLAHFLVDAETFWDGQSGGELRSGPWSEQTEDGKTGLLEAVACFLGARRVMYIRKLGTDLREKMAVLQRARENRLAYERLESAQKALRQSEAQNRALIGRLEASNANLVVVLDQLRIGTLLLDQQGRVLFMNRSAQRILGCDQKGGSASIGRASGHFRKRPGPDFRRCLRVHLKRGAASRHPCRYPESAIIGWRSTPTTIPATPSEKYCFFMTSPRYRISAA